MARQDFYIKKLLQDRARFADLYNAEIFHGKQILKAELLSPVSLESGIVITDRNGRRQTIQRRRDIAMKASLGACFIAACCEAQGEVHYGMPVRVLTYDALDYTEQLTDIQKEHRKKKDLTKSPEFLSGITRQDKLVPILTLVLYCGKNPWEMCIRDSFRPCGRIFQDISCKYLPAGQDNHSQKTDARKAV